MNANDYSHFDPTALLKDLFDSVDIIRTVLESFGEWHDSTQIELRTAAETGDAVHLARITHTLRGTLAQIHAKTAVGLALTLEERCKTCAGFQPGPADVEPLQHELEAVAGDIVHYLARL